MLAYTEARCDVGDFQTKVKSLRHEASCHMLKYFTDWRNLKEKVRWMLYTRQRKKLSLLWRCAPKPVAILQSVSSQGSARYMIFFFGLFNGFSTMTTHNDIRTYLMHPACFPGRAQMLQTASAAFGRFDLHLVWSELMLVIKIHWKWSLDINLRTHKKYLECILVAHCRTKICKHLLLFKGCNKAWN